MGTSTYTKAVSMGHQLCHSAQPCTHRGGKGQRGWEGAEDSRGGHKASACRSQPADQPPAFAAGTGSRGLTRNCSSRPREKAAARAPNLQRGTGGTEAAWMGEQDRGQNQHCLCGPPAAVQLTRAHPE